MQYRYFASGFGEVVDQFVNIYGKNNVLFAQTQREFETCLNCKKHYKVIVLETFLFFDILTEDNIYYVKDLEKYFDYIIFAGKNIEKLNIKIKKILDRK